MDLDASLNVVWAANRPEGIALGHRLLGDVLEVAEHVREPGLVLNLDVPASTQRLPRGQILSERRRLERPAFGSLLEPRQDVVKQLGAPRIELVVERLRAEQPPIGDQLAVLLPQLALPLGLTAYMLERAPG